MSPAGESTDRSRTLIKRIPLARMIEGGAIGVALWCMLFAFRLLPGVAADTTGVLLFALAGIVAGAVNLRIVLVTMLALGAAVVLLATQTSLSNTAAHRWIRQDPLPDSALSAVVVLSAGVNPNNTISSDALDNMITGLELVRAGKADVLVTTSVEEKFPGGIVSSNVDQSRMVTLFGDSARWIRTPLGHSTRDEAMRSAELLLPQGRRRIAVVVAPMHTRRACAAFEAVGFRVTCVPARVRSPGGSDPAPWPEDRLRVFGDLVYEVAATAKYRAQGWLGSPPVP